MSMEELLVTEEMISNIRTDLDFFQSITYSHIRCENVAVYDKLMDWCGQLHQSSWGNREDLTIVI